MTTSINSTSVRSSPLYQEKHKLKIVHLEILRKSEMPSQCIDRFDIHVINIQQDDSLIVVEQIDEDHRACAYLRVR